MNSIYAAAIGSFLLILFGYSFFRYKEKIKAQNRFLDSFEPELLVLRNPNQIVYETLRNSFDKHELAVNGFDRHLRERKRLAMNKAWKNYHHNQNGKRLQQYMSTGNHEETEKRRLVALHNLESVLKFAGYKPPV
jgi:hypothetical protein